MPEITNIPKTAKVDNVTIEKDSTTSELQVKDGGINDKKIKSEDMALRQIEVLELQANASIIPTDYDTLVSDTFSDSTGYKDSVNTGVTNPLFETNHYIEFDENAGLAQDNYTSINQSVNKLIAEADGIINRVAVSALNGGDVTIRIEKPAGNVIASKTITAGADDYDIVEFTEDDYSETLSNGDSFIVRVSGSGVGLYTKNETQSFDKTYFKSDGSQSYLISCKSGKIPILAFKPSSVSQEIIIDLPSISGEVVATQLIARSEGRDVTYTLYDGTNSDTGLVVDTYNELVNVDGTALSGQSQGLKIDMTGVSKVYGFVLKLWKA